MSNIGKQYIKLPQGVIINIINNKILVKGNKGNLIRDIPENLTVIKRGSYIYIYPNNYDNLHPHRFSEWGTFRSNLKNMIKGVHQGFYIKLQLVGIGYKVSIEKDILILKLGFSHLVYFKIPSDIKIQILKSTLLSIHGIDYKYLTEIAHKIRSLKIPEPYKGKGIRYLNEIIIKKEGKKQ